MKTLRIVPVTLLLMAGVPATYAQSIPTLVAQADMTFGPSPGGDNQRTMFVGPGVNLQSFGSVGCEWCIGFGSFSNAPGTSLEPTIPQAQLDFNGLLGVFGRVRVGGHTLVCPSTDGSSCLLISQTLTAQHFRFPLNCSGCSDGHTFTVTVPAAFDGLLMGSGGAGLDFTQFDLQIPSGEMELSFEFVPAQGLAPAYFAFLDGEFKTPMFPTPEPGALGLMATGLAGVLGLRSRRRKLG